MMSLFFKFLFVFFFTLSVSANDLCEILKDENTVIPSKAIKENFVISKDTNIDKWKISNQSYLSEITFTQNLAYPSFSLEEYINTNYPNIIKRECYIYNHDLIENILSRVSHYLPQIRSNRDISMKYNSLEVYEVSWDPNYEGSYWMIEYEYQKKIEMVNYNYFTNFPFDKIDTFINFEFSELEMIDVIDNYEEIKKDFYGENEMTQQDWNIRNINVLSGLHEFELKEHLIYNEPFYFTNGSEYANIVYYFSFNRNFNFYILKIIIPVIFLVLLSFSVFWIRNSEIEAKLNVSIVCLLALIAYNFAVNADIPKLNSLTILDSFILISYLFAGLATFITIYSYYDYRRDKLTGDFNPLDLKLRWIAPLFYFIGTFGSSYLIYIL